MRSLKIFFLLAIILLDLAITLSATPSELQESFLGDNNDNDDDDATYDNSDPQEATSMLLRGTNRILAQNSRPREVMTCNKYPRVCRAKGSPGPDCCKKRCVNVMTDRLNCGQCGKKCKYPEICCKGQCVNPMSNKRHCGGCNNNCKKGSACVYGMCSYA